MKKHIICIITLSLIISSCKENKIETKANTETETKEVSEYATLKSALTFHTSFDETIDADFSKGDSKLYSVMNRKELDSAKVGLHKDAVSLSKSKGKYGGSLHFEDKTKGYIFYKSEGNINYSKTDWSGSISFWLSLNPDKDLKPGYCDPIQITDSGYNDAGIWVDFTKTLPRQFRLGIIGDRDVWNPNPEGPDNENPKFLEQLMTAKDATFGNNKWTHVVINFSNLNTKAGKAEFYVDGKKASTSQIEEAFTWNYSKSNILLGLSYIGLLDDLSIYDKSLTKEEIETIFNLKNGVKSIMN